MMLTRSYDADINNDGKIEHVLVFDFFGTKKWGNIAKLEALQEDGQYLKSIGAPPSPSDYKEKARFYSTWFSNPLTNQDRLLAQLNGKTYMCFDKNHFRDTYLWKDGKTVDACDNDWANFERSCFQSQYKTGLYNESIGQLKFYAKKCKGKMNSALYLWIQNDLALASLKTGEIEQSKAMISEIENNPMYPQASAQFKKAVSFNKLLCTQQDKHQTDLDKPWGKEQYTWLLQHLRIDPDLYRANMQKLIINTLPKQNPMEESTIKATYESFCHANVDDRNKHIVWLLYTNESNDRDRSFIWVDLEKGTTLLAHFMAANNQYSLHITSKNFMIDNVPINARRDLKKWVKNSIEEYIDEKYEKFNWKTATFHDVRGNETKLSSAWVEQR